VPAAQPAVRDLIQKHATEVQSGRDYYETVATIQLRAVIALASTGERREAEERWQRACQCFGGYGFRKDITIYELIESLPVLIEHDRAFVRQMLDRLQPLIWELDWRTDGRETDRAVVSWFDVVSQADPTAAALLLARCLSRDGGIVYWRLEDFLDKLLGRIGERADPLVAMALLQTQPSRAAQPYVETA